MKPQNSLLTRRVEKILPSAAGLTQLIKDKGGKIRLYQGFDPTGIHLHLGHSVGLRKLMEFARAGHEVIFLFGTGTVLVGDPSQRDTGRKLITPSEIAANLATWRQQVAPLVDFDLVTIKDNGAWLLSLTLKDLIHIASHISAVQLFKRDMFQRRLSHGDTVWYHETMYPLLQGYDSVVMDVDLEIGGSDQEFNMLIGRELMQKMKHKDKFVLTTPMILGLDGKTMSKTSGNCIYLDDPPDTMFAKVMGLIDSQILTYFDLVTDVDRPTIDDYKTDLESVNPHPLHIKKKLAYTIVSDWHGQKKAQAAQTNFVNTFQKHSLPTNLTPTAVPPGPITLIDLLKLLDIEASNSQMKRVILEGGVEFAGRQMTDPQARVTPENGAFIKYGKHTFRQLQLKKG